MTTLLIISLIFNGLCLSVWVLNGYVGFRKSYLRLQEMIEVRRKMCHSNEES